jgi:hypothetical protein
MGSPSVSGDLERFDVGGGRQHELGLSGDLDDLEIDNDDDDAFDDDDDF